MLARSGARALGARAAALRATSSLAGASSALRSATSTRGFASLVSSEWVRESREKLLIVDCDQPVAFQRAHIPNAQPFAPAASGLKDPNSTGVIDERTFKQVLDMLQVEDDATLVFYDDDFGLKATRLWWVFRHFGFPKEQLKVLDGGWKHWVAGANAVSTGSPQEITPSAPLWSAIAPCGALVDLAAVQQGLADGATQFVDTRSAAEYTGRNANGNARTGHVPGAVHFEWVDAVDRTGAGTFKSERELASVLVDTLALRSDQPVVTYCQRGIRAAHTAFVLSEVLGFADVKIYENSMAQYLNRSNTTVEQ